MTKNWLLSCACLICLLCSIGAATASTQSTPSAHPEQQTSPAKTSPEITVTGCLRRGNEANTYVITDENGTTWYLSARKSDIDLRRQVFHSVTVTGNEANPTPEASDATHENTSRRSLDVVRLDLLSRSCTR